MGEIPVAVVGMTFGREHIVWTIAEDDPVLLVPEPDNPHDPNAVAVFTAPPHGVFGTVKRTPDGWQIDDVARQKMLDRQAGYIPRDVAARLHLPAVGVASRVVNVRYHDGEPKGFDVAVRREWMR